MTKKISHVLLTEVLNITIEVSESENKGNGCMKLTRKTIFSELNSDMNLQMYKTY